MVGLKPLPAQTIEHQRSEDVSEKGYELLTITNRDYFICKPAGCPKMFKLSDYSESIISCPLLGVRQYPSMLFPL